MAFVFVVIADSIFETSRFPVSGSTSTKIGRAPAEIIAVTVAIKVIGVVMTSSPDPIPNAKRDMCNAPVQLVVPIAYFALRKDAKRDSNSATVSPVVRMGPFNTSPTASSSARPRE